MRFATSVLTLLLLVAVTTRSQAAIITEFVSLGAYNAAVGAHTIITFTEVPIGSTLTSQYSGLGVTFSDGNDTTRSDSAFVVDGVGAAGNGRFDLSFSTQSTHIGAEFPGALRIELYNDANLLATSSDFAGSGSGFFGGVLSTPFNRVVLIDWFDDLVFIDNLHFGVPEPCTFTLTTLALLGLVAHGHHRRRV